MNRPTVKYKPEEDGHLVVFKACWVADNGYETAVFATQAEAVDFARKHWRQEPLVLGDEGDSQ